MVESVLRSDKAKTFVCFVFFLFFLFFVFFFFFFGFFPEKKRLLQVNICAAVKLYRGNAGQWEPLRVGAIVATTVNKSFFFFFFSFLFFFFFSLF